MTTNGRCPARNPGDPAASCIRDEGHAGEHLFQGVLWSDDDLGGSQ